MRAIVFESKGEVAVRADLEAPSLGDQEVRLLTLYTGLTVGTERHVLLGGPYASDFPIIPGYQTVSRVIDCGANVTAFAVGDLVYSDGGSKPVNFEGTCWGGHLEVRNRPSTGNLIKIPAGVDLQDAALFGILSIGMRAAKRAKVSVHDRVLVLGQGLIGQACLQASMALGADVSVVDLMPERLDLARQLGCTTAWDGAKPDIWETITASGNYDVIFETTGVADMPDRIMPTLRHSSGRLVAIGGKFEMKYHNLNSGQAREATIIHTSHFQPEDLQDAARLVAQGRLHVTPLITHRVDVAEAPTIYEKVVNDPSGLLGVVFHWNE